MSYIGQPLNAGNLAVQTGTGDGADTTPIATLDYSVGSSESLAIYLDGVKQAVSTYTASGTTLTFTTAPPNGVGIEVVFLALPISLPTPGDNTVGLNQLNTTGTPDGSLFLRDDLVWSGAGGAVVALATTTASGDSSIDFKSTDGINHATYSHYILTWQNVVPSADANLNIRLSDDDGSTFEADAGDYCWAVSGMDVDGVAVSNYSASATSIGLTTNPQPSAGIGTCGELTWFPVRGATAGNNEMIWAISGDEVTSGDRHHANGFGGTLNVAGDSGGFDAIQFIQNTGTITSGIFNLYGVTKPS